MSNMHSALLVAWYTGTFCSQGCRSCSTPSIKEVDPTNGYINLSTIVDGATCTLAEEYHVVHHQYAGAHWSKHEPLYEKHMDGYHACIPTAFHKQNILEVFGTILAGDYMELARNYYQLLNPGLTQEQLAGVLKRRLQSSGIALARKVGRTAAAKGDVAQYE